MIEILNEDCIAVMNRMAEGSIDCVLTDPPYLTTDLHFDKDGIDMDGFIKAVLRVLKPSDYFISFGSIELLGQLCPHFPIRWSGAWVKPNGVMRTAAAKKPRSRCITHTVMAHPDHKISELTYNKLYIEGEPYRSTQRKAEFKRGGQDSLSRINSSAWGIDGYVIENTGTREQTDVIYAPSKNYMAIAERTDHPTQKSVQLMKTLLYMCTKEGDLVLEPFCGSGTTAVACHELNRNCIATEIHRPYYEIARERLAGVTAQQVLGV